jgi:phage repressor protein C with HTH and peptisase S24 domain
MPYNVGYVQLYLKRFHMLDQTASSVVSKNHSYPNIYLSFKTTYVFATNVINFLPMWAE